MDDLTAVRKRAVYIGSEEIVSGISVFVNRFIKNKSLCLKALNVLCTSGVDRCSKLSPTIICYILHYIFIYLSETYRFKTDIPSIIKGIVNAYLDDFEMCELGCHTLSKIFYGMDSKQPLKKTNIHIYLCFFPLFKDSRLIGIDREGYIELSLKIMNSYIKNVDICISGLDVLLKMVDIDSK